MSRRATGTSARPDLSGIAHADAGQDRRCSPLSRLEQQADRHGVFCFSRSRHTGADRLLDRSNHDRPADFRIGILDVACHGWSRPLMTALLDPSTVSGCLGRYD